MIESTSPFYQAQWQKALNYAKMMGNLDVNEQDIKLIVALDATSQKFRFRLRDEDQELLTGENRLNQSDAAVVTAIGFHVITAASAAAIPSAVPCTYESQTLDLANAAGLPALWNATLNYKVGQDEVLPAYPLLRHKYVPQTQFGTSVTAFVNAASADDIDTQPYDQFPEDAGFRAAAPWNLILDGAPNTQINLELAAAVDLVPGSGTNYAVLTFRSFVITGGAGLAAQLNKMNG